MRRHFPVVLVGNALSAMVAATKLARDGADVAIVNSSKNWGGHFTTFSCHGVTFDPGMVLHEFTSYNSRTPQDDIRTYDPAIRNDAGRFCATVHRFVGDYQGTHSIATPKMYVEGAAYDDILIANALWSLPRLSFAARTKHELLGIVNRPALSPLHASRKHESDDFKLTDYATASLANHGATFHARLIEPFCFKLFNVSAESLVSLYHRVAWLPLFYPETLLSYLQGSPQSLPPTVFSYPVKECVGDLAHKLRVQIDNNPRITVIADRPVSVKASSGATVDVALANGDLVSGDRVAWANSPGDLLRTLGLEEYVATYQKCSIALAFLRVPSKALKIDFTVLSIVDAAVRAYRITNQTRCAGVDSEHAHLVAEFNPDYGRHSEPGPSGSEYLETFGRDLVSLGIVASRSDIEVLEVKHMSNALMLPSDSNRRSFLREFNAVRVTAPQLSLLGPASGFFSSSFNDQVVQGLKLASQWGHAA